MGRAWMLPALAVISSVGLFAFAACSSFGEDQPSEDASMPEGAPPGDAGADVPPPPDARLDAACPSFAIFCDDFELGDLRRWGPKDSRAPSSLTVDDGGPPHRGASALHFSTTQNLDAGVVVASYASLRSMAFPAAVSAGTIAVRFYVKGSTVPSDGTTLVWLTKGPSDEAESILYTSFGNWGSEAIAGSLGTAELVPSNVMFEPGRWLCVEWVVDVGAAGRHQLFIDGNVVPVLSGNLDTIGDAGAGYQYASIYMNNQGAKTQELFFDDIAVAVLPARADGPRIGCIP